ncbi:YidC/Oxa1 family membrane protein insertase [Luethyella okanaganae]|uniref:Membrane protein insertase YidC n=1 Tax=Luethyella okanaganae TaxID=69372 RepID=A0ABW1VEP5_9MICO
MDIYSFAPIAAALDAAYTVITGLSEGLVPVFGVAASATAIVLVTLAVRALLIPVGLSQARSERARRRLAPRLAELRRRYGKSRELLQRKTMELYTSENVSPFAGCLPLLAQAPIVSLIYALFILPAINGHANALLSDELLGVSLGSSLSQLLASGGIALSSAAVFAGLVVVIALVAQLSRIVLRPATNPVAPASTVESESSRRIARVLGYAPFATVFVAAFVPLAAGLYLLVTVTWTLCERLVLRRILGP